MMLNLYRLPRRKTPRNDDGGFSLFELLLVLTLAMIITTVGVVNLSRLQNTFRLRSSADEIIAMLQLGRELAVSNKNQAIYNISISGGVVSLQGGGKVISRYQIPIGVGVTPESINWSFTPITGGLASCLSCSINLFIGSQTENIIVLNNGLVN